MYTFFHRAPMLAAVYIYMLYMHIKERSILRYFPMCITDMHPLKGPHSACESHAVFNTQYLMTQRPKHTVSSSKNQSLLQDNLGSLQTLV